MGVCDPARDAEAALQELLDGNARFASGSPAHPNRDAARREGLVAGQQPFAAVVACSDSRVPPELLFDRGFGDLFVVRVAGNVVDRAALGSIEYAALHLHVPLIMVLGHSGCGAVTAVLSDAEFEGELLAVAELLRPAVDICAGESDVDSVAKANATLTAEWLARRSVLLGDVVRSGETKIVAAFYDMTTGRVSVL
jgi:carbonic anhydrase